MTVTLRMPPELETRLRDEAAKAGLDADTYIVRALERILPQPTPQPPAALSPRESELFDKINIGLSQQEWRRYHELIEKREDEAISQGELDELIATTDHVERLNVTRMKHVIELAKLRNVPLEQLMDELGIGNGRDAVRGLKGE